MDTVAQSPEQWRELNQLLDQAASRLTAREQEVADLQSRLQGERRRSETLETQLKAKEAEVMELLRQKGLLERRVREVEDRSDQDHRALQRANAELMAQADSLRGRVKEFEDQRSDLERAKFKFDQVLAVQATTFQDQLAQDRKMIGGLYDLTQRFFQEMHQTAQAHHQELIKLQKELDHQQIDLKKTGIDFQGRADLLVQKTEGLKAWMADRWKETFQGLETVGERLNRQAEGLQGVESRIVLRSGEAWEGVQRGLGDLGKQMGEVLATLEILQKDRQRKDVQPVGVGEEFYAEMMFGISHQLKNPLGVIRSNAQLCLASSAKKPKERRLLEAIVSSCDQMQERLMEFVELTKPVQYLMTSVHLPAVLDEALAMIQVRADEQKVTVEKRYADLPWVPLDAQKFKSSMLHVFVNALDAMPGGGRMVVEVGSHEGMAVIKVQDGGQGITAQDLEKVWQPFFTTKEGHLGVGLVSLWRFVVSHRGTVDIQSVEGVGTTLIIRLPLAVS